MVSRADQRLGAVLTCPECGREYDGHTASRPIPCPSCRHEFRGHWHESREPEAQQCPSCGHTFDLGWYDGFTIEPTETVVVRAIPCPSCGQPTIGSWRQSDAPEHQRCESCGHQYDAPWPGRRLEPEQTIWRAHDPQRSPAVEVAAHRALLCPSCGQPMIGSWRRDGEPDAQQCRSCGHQFDAPWPGGAA